LPRDLLSISAQDPSLRLKSGFGWYDAPSTFIASGNSSLPHSSCITPDHCTFGLF